MANLNELDLSFNHIFYRILLQLIWRIIPFGVLISIETKKIQILLELLWCDSITSHFIQFVRKKIAITVTNKKKKIFHESKALLNYPTIY